MSDLIVSDEEFTSYKEAVAALAEIAENRLQDYLAIMRNVRKTAVLEGLVGQRLDEYISTTQAVLGQTVPVLSMTIGNEITSFLQEIDEKDEYLY